MLRLTQKHIHALHAPKFKQLVFIYILISTKCTVFYSEKIADISAYGLVQYCRAAERVSHRMSYQQRRQHLATDHEVQNTQNKSTRGVE